MTIQAFSKKYVFSIIYRISITMQMCTSYYCTKFNLHRVNQLGTNWSKPMYVGLGEESQLKGV